MAVQVVRDFQANPGKMDTEENPACQDSLVKMEDLGLMAEEDSQEGTATKESGVSSALWPNKADEVLTGFQDYQVKMVGRDSTEFLDAMAKTIPDQVDLVTMEGPELVDCLAFPETTVWPV